MVNNRPSLCWKNACRMRVSWLLQRGRKHVAANRSMEHPGIMPRSERKWPSERTFGVGTLRSPIEDEYFVNSPDTVTPEGQVPPLVTPFILPAGERPIPAVARFFNCGRNNQACCISVLKFGAFGSCFRGSVCRTERIFPVCEDVDPGPPGGCAASGGAVVRGFCSSSF